MVTSKQPNNSKLQSDRSDIYRLVIHLWTGEVDWTDEQLGGSCPFLLLPVSIGNPCPLPAMKGGFSKTNKMHEVNLENKIVFFSIVGGLRRHL